MRRLDELNWPELAALDHARTVVFVPISPIEEHGPHLPLGTDFYVAQALCERTALEVERRLPGVSCLLAPPVPIGCGVLPMVGSLGVRQRAVRDVVLAMGRSLARDGFRTIVVISGHLGLTHLAAIKVAAARVSRRFGVSMLAPAPEVGMEVLRGAESGGLFAGLAAPLTEEEQSALTTFHHAGALETSVMLHLHPELVRPVYRSLPPLPRLAYLTWRGRRPGRFQGYVGQPARARADAGAVVVAALVAAATDLVERTLAGQVALLSGDTPRRTALARAPSVPRPLWVGALGALGLAGVGAASARWRRVVRWPGAAHTPHTARPSSPHDIGP
jgi:creatinine amidohydrolase